MEQDQRERVPLVEENQVVVRGKAQVKGRAEARTKMVVEAEWVEVDLVLAEIVPARNAEPQHLTNGVNLVCSRNVLNAGLQWYEHEGRRGRSNEDSICKRQRRNRENNHCSQSRIFPGPFKSKGPVS